MPRWVGCPAWSASAESDARRRRSGASLPGPTAFTSKSRPSSRRVGRLRTSRMSPRRSILEALPPARLPAELAVEDAVGAGVRLAGLGRRRATGTSGHASPRGTRTLSSISRSSAPRSRTSPRSPSATSPTRPAAGRYRTSCGCASEDLIRRPVVSGDERAARLRPRRRRAPVDRFRPRRTRGAGSASGSETGTARVDRRVRQAGRSRSTAAPAAMPRGRRSSGPRDCPRTRRSIPASASSSRSPSCWPTGCWPRAVSIALAIVGPGLDFVDKRQGTDFYPVQTIQPFAVVDSADPARSRPAGPGSRDDVRRQPEGQSPPRGGAAAGGRRRAPTCSTCRNGRICFAGARIWSAYWANLGDRIGTAIPPVVAPPGHGASSGCAPCASVPTS